MDVRKRSIKTSPRQYEIYCDFIAEYPIMRTGKLLPGMNGDSVDCLWRLLASRLNSCGCGAQKDVKGWKNVFTEWKSNIRRKSRELLVEQQATGGGEKKCKPLTQLEERLLSLVGRVAVEGIAGLMESPIQQVTATEEEVPEEAFTVEVPTEELLFDRSVTVLSSISDSSTNIGTATISAPSCSWQHATENCTSVSEPSESPRIQQRDNPISQFLVLYGIKRRRREEEMGKTRIFEEMKKTFEDSVKNNEETNNKLAAALNKIGDALTSIAASQRKLAEAQYLRTRLLYLEANVKIPDSTE